MISIIDFFTDTTYFKKLQKSKPFEHCNMKCDFTSRYIIIGNFKYDYKKLEGDILN